jgi:hypothetical protein
MALSSRDAPPFLPGLAPARGLLGRLRDRLVRPLVLGVVKKAFLPSLNRVRAEVGAARLQRFVPHGPLLEGAVCAMTHGGMGATQKALVHGVPVCVVPFGRDRLEVARRVEVAAPELACQRHGCGRTSCATGSTRRRRRPALPDESPRRSRPGARVVSGESRELISGSSRGRRPLRRSQRRVRMLYRWVHQSEQVSNRPPHRRRCKPPGPKCSSDGARCSPQSDQRCAVRHGPSRVRHFSSGDPRRQTGYRFQNPCDGTRKARLKREDAFSHAMIIVSSAMASSS